MTSPSTLPLAADGDCLQALRLSTRALHRRLDSQLPIAKQNASLADYVSHLQVLHGWLGQVCAPLGRVGWGGEYREVVRGDIAEAGATPAVARVIDLPDAGLPFAWGVAYVVEGSQLGGQVLHKRLRETAVPPSLHALRYLAGRGQETGAHWVLFLAALRAALHRPDDTAQACNGAQWAFEGLIAQYGLDGPAR